MANKIKGRITQTAMAEKAGVTVKTLLEWRKEGINIESEEEVLTRAEKTKERFAKSEDMSEVKLRKLRAEADLKEHELEVERGMYVSQESQRADGQKFGLVIQGVFQKMADDLTPIIAGRPAGEVKKAIQKYAREKLTEISQYDPHSVS